MTNEQGMWWLHDLQIIIKTAQLGAQMRFSRWVYCNHGYEPTSVGIMTGTALPSGVKTSGSVLIDVMLQFVYVEIVVYVFIWILY